MTTIYLWDGMKKKISAVNEVEIVMIRGGSRIFSRGGGVVDFQKKMSKFLSTFFLGRPN